MKRLFQKAVLLFIVLMACQNVYSQRVALRTNVIDWATLSPNLTLETRLSGKLTLGLGFVGNPFPWYIADTRLNNFRFQPELRYWFNRPMARHFMGFAMVGAMYDFRHKEKIYQGDVFGAGLTYGYALVLGKQWNVEFTAGVGIGKTRCFKYTKEERKPDSPNYSKWIPIPINVGVSFTYIFK